MLCLGQLSRTATGGVYIPAKVHSNIEHRQSTKGLDLRLESVYPTSKMTYVPFSVVDVFASTPYQGNPLSIVDNTHGLLSKTQMRLISRQFNLSETTFFSRPDDCQADFKLQSFLPNGKEVFGAGHNILGVWWYLAQSQRLEFDNPTRVSDNGDEEHEFSQEIGGKISGVKITRQPTPRGYEFGVIVRQAPPNAHGYHPNVEALAQSIGLKSEDLGLPGWSQLKPRVMSTSTTRHLIVPVKSVEGLNKIVVQHEKLTQQLQTADKQCYGLYLFTLEDGNRYQARFFSPGMSGEDPATGSAAGPLARYLHDHGLLRLVEDEGKIQVTQGLQVGRRCVIDVVLNVQDQESPETDIVGSGAQVMSGTIRIPGTELRF